MRCDYIFSDSFIGSFNLSSENSNDYYSDLLNLIKPESPDSETTFTIIV